MSIINTNVTINNNINASNNANYNFPNRIDRETSSFMLHNNWNYPILN